MKIQIRIATLILLFSCLFSNFSLAQNSKEKPKESLHNNAIYVTGGYALLYAMASGTYERILVKSKDNQLAFLAKVGYGKYVVWTDHGDLFMGEVGMLTGARNSHLELNLGIVMSNQYYQKEYFPAGSIGYRFQKPGGHFIFRTGVGFPETAFISFGVSF